jgi:hypothetical protein
MSIEGGTYRAKAIAGSEQYGTTSNNHDQIVIDFDLLDIGERVSVFLVFSEKAAPHSIKRLRVAGWSGDDLSNLVGLGSTECEILVKYEDYQGQQKMKTEIVSGGTVTLKTQFDDKTKKAFGAKFRDLAKATPKPTAQASNGTTKPADPAAAGGTGDEIPF